MESMQEVVKLRELLDWYPASMGAFIRHAIIVEIKISSIKGFIRAKKPVPQNLIFELWNAISGWYGEFARLVSHYKPGELLEVQETIKTIKEIVLNSDVWEATEQKRTGKLLKMLASFYTEIFSATMQPLFILKEGIENAIPGQFCSDTIPRFTYLRELVTQQPEPKPGQEKTKTDILKIIQDNEPITCEQIGTIAKLTPRRIRDYIPMLTGEISKHHQGKNLFYATKAFDFKAWEKQQT